MRPDILAVAVLAACASTMAAVSAQQSAPGLPRELEHRIEVQALKERLWQLEYTVAQLQAENADLRARLAGPALTAERDQLVKSRADLDALAKSALGCQQTDTIDWKTTPPSCVKGQ